MRIVSHLIFRGHRWKVADKKPKLRQIPNLEERINEVRNLESWLVLAMAETVGVDALVQTSS